MDAIFRVEREKQNFLFYKEYQNDKAILGFHSHIELYFVDEGEMEMTVNGHHKTLKQDEMCVVLSFDAHSYQTPVHSRSRVLIIPTYLCTEFMEMIKDKRAVSPFLCTADVVRQIRTLVGELNQCGDNEIKRQGYIYVILGLVLENIGLETVEEQLDTKLATRFLIYVNNHFREPINLKTAAASLGYNQSYLSRYFKTQFHIGFNQYLTTIRLKNALMLMHEKKHKLTYCALESGFNSLRTFYRAFDKEFGCTPKEYMKEIFSQA